MRLLVVVVVGREVGVEGDGPPATAPSAAAALAAPVAPAPAPASPSARWVGRLGRRRRLLARLRLARLLVETVAR